MIDEKTTRLRAIATRLRELQSQILVDAQYVDNREEAWDRVPLELRDAAAEIGEQSDALDALAAE